MTWLKKIALAAACLMALAPAAQAAAGDADSEDVYTMVGLNGEAVMSLAGRIYPGDEYISADNQLYVVVEVDDAARRAVAQCLGDEPAYDAEIARAVFAQAESGKDTKAKGSGKKLIAMYSTHSDESYEKGDGSASKEGSGGIYDVDKALKQQLEKLGIEVALDTTTHLPHDAKAYSRSRRTAEELMKLRPDAILDIHRDGIPDESEYETTVDGEETSKVRLLVGRSNPNASVNREFAKQIKAVADEKYEGLVKDIFIGKGDYNQEISPKSLLLEFGTHTTDKDQAMDATKYMADILNTVLYGGSAKAEGAGGSKGALRGLGWLIAVAALGGLIYALISTGTLKNLGSKLSGGASELTGGLVGRDNEAGQDDDPDDGE